MTVTAQRAKKMIDDAKYVKISAGIAVPFDELDEIFEGLSACVLAAAEAKDRFGKIKGTLTAEDLAPPKYHLSAGYPGYYQGLDHERLQRIQHYRAAWLAMQIELGNLFIITHKTNNYIVQNYLGRKEVSKLPVCQGMLFWYNFMGLANFLKECVSMIQELHDFCSEQPNHYHAIPYGCPPGGPEISVDWESLGRACLTGTMR